jgi:hypothetical protein
VTGNSRAKQPSWQLAFCPPKGTFGMWDGKTGECLGAFHIDSYREYLARLESFSNQWVETRGLATLMTRGAM